MRIIIFTPIRLLGEGLVFCLQCRPDMIFQDIVSDFAALRCALNATAVDLVLIDVTQGIDLDEVRALAMENSELALVALGLQEQRQEVIRCGRAGFAGYVARDATVDALCNAMADIVAGRLTCSAEVSGGLLRALFRLDSQTDQSPLSVALTRREGDVLQLIGRGLSNKEIAHDLCLSVATVKHHVHKVLEKLHVSRRAQAMRKAREAPWIMSSVTLDGKRRVD